MSEMLNYRAAAKFPAYRALVRAVDDLRNTLEAAELHLSSEDFFALVDRVARLQPYLDYCARCYGVGVSTGAAVFDTSAPHTLSRTDDEVRASYECYKCKYMWNTSWAEVATEKPRSLKPPGA